MRIKYGHDEVQRIQKDLTVLAAVFHHNILFKPRCFSDKSFGFTRNCTGKFWCIPKTKFSSTLSEV